MKLLRYIYRVALALSVLCFGLRAWLGDRVDADGFLHEPFFLIVLGYGFFFIGVVAAIAALCLWYGGGKPKN